VPDPQDPATFECSKLRPDEGDADLLAFYKRLVRLRRDLAKEVAVEADEAARVLRVTRGRAELALDVPTRGVALRA
jgi:hypothetical protein